MDIQKRAIKKLFTRVESPASAVGLLNSGEQRYIKAISSSSSNNEVHNNSTLTRSDLRAGRSTDAVAETIRGES